LAQLRGKHDLSSYFGYFTGKPTISLDFVILKNPTKTHASTTKKEKKGPFHSEKKRIYFIFSLLDE